MAWAYLISICASLWTIAVVLWHGERLFWRKRGAHQWGEEHGERFEYREVRNENQGLSSIVMSFAVPAHWRFRLRPETWYDRLSKRLRLAHEPQLGDAEFDALLYIETDQAAMLQSWRENQSLRDHVKSLLKRIHAHEAALYGLVCEDGKLHVHLTVLRVASVDKLRVETVAWLLPLLASLRDESVLNRCATAEGKPSKRGFDLARLVCFGLFLGGTHMLLWYMLFGIEPLLDMLSLLKFSLLCSAIAFPILLWWAMVRTGAHPERHRRFLEWLFLGSLGPMLSSFFLIRAVNRYLDFGEPQSIAVTEVVLVEGNVGRMGIRHFFHCRSESELLGRYEIIPISAHQYRRLKSAWGATQRDSGVVHLHAGALGHPWVEPWH